MRVIGVDIGGTKVAAGLVEATLGSRPIVTARARGPVDPTTNSGGIASILAVVDQVWRDASKHGPSVAAIGVACAGSVDHHDGVLRRASNMSWTDLGIAEALGDRYGVPVTVENDVNAAAWGEAIFGDPDRETSSAIPTLAYITVGTGIGTGAVEGGRIIRGRAGGAGEFGHLPGLAGTVDPDAALVVCSCGARGCVEAVASGPAFAVAGQTWARDGRAPGLVEASHGDLSGIDAAMITRAATSGDAGALQLVAREARFIAQTIAVAWRAYSPDVIVLGGGVMSAGDVMLKAVHVGLSSLAVTGPARLRECSSWVLPARLGNDAGVIGAGALVVVRPAG
ncbi:MAG: ROK family protein [Chloroflexi bacterium]|nr:ROK family protein [Chloroflexota bacterium]